jgi:hypothetical protein
MVTLQVALVPEPAHAPPHPVNVEPAAGVAVSVTEAPVESFSEQVPVTLPLIIAQLIAGEAEEFDVTEPAPDPSSVTVSV